MAADAALEEDLLAAQQVLLGHWQRVAGEPVAAVDLREVRRFFELSGRYLDVRALLNRGVRSLEAGRRGLEALVRDHDVLRVELPGIPEQPGLTAAHLHERDQLLDLLVGEEGLHLRHQRERVDEPWVVEMRPLPVVRVPAGLLREVGTGALRAEQVRRLVAAPEVPRLGDLRVQEVQRVPYVLRPRVARVTDVAAVLGEEVAARDRLVREGRPVCGGRRVERVDRKPHDDRDDREEGDEPAQACDERGDQHALPRMASPAARDAFLQRGVVAVGVVRTAHALAVGAIASATMRVSRRLRSVVSVKIVMPMFTICTIPDSTIIAPKMPRAM